jgi:hypothetical protein
MRLIGYRNLVLAVALAALTLAPMAYAATPNPTSAILNLRVFNDCPISVLTTTNGYPGSILIQDENLSCGGFANLHNWRFSQDGSTAIRFPNSSAFRFYADLVIDGTSEGEAGLSVAPWWAADVDGRFNVRTTDGEIACFGGRLPFYSFTSNQGLTYTKGETIGLQVTYLPNDLDELAPATIEYEVFLGGMTYTSGPLPFDEGNPAEDPPYGLWGMLNDAQVGGYVQCFLQAGNPEAALSAEWLRIDFENLDSVPTETRSWGSLKAGFEKK